jgi:hypothetical protein
MAELTYEKTKDGIQYKTYGKLALNDTFKCKASSVHEKDQSANGKSWVNYTVEVYSINTIGASEGEKLYVQLTPGQYKGVVKHGDLGNKTFECYEYDYEVEFNGKKQKKVGVGCGLKSEKPKNVPTIVSKPKFGSPVAKSAPVVLPDVCKEFCDYVVTEKTAFAVHTKTIDTFKKCIAVYVHDNELPHDITDEQMTEMYRQVTQ